MNLSLEIIGKSIGIFKEVLSDKKNKDRMESDNDVISKLKFIGKIQKGEKINVRSMYVQPDGIATKISRSFINVDSRANTLNFLNNTIKRSFDLINLHQNSVTPFDVNLVLNLIKDLKESKTGIENLKGTYSSDIMFCCQLETLIQDIDGRLSSMKEKKEEKEEERNEINRKDDKKKVKD